MRLETNPNGGAQIRIGRYTVTEKSGFAQNIPLIFANKQIPTKM
jgi:hypothetical protein